MKIDENLPVIKENIKRACEKCARDVNDVTILAVTKTMDAQNINRAIELGLVNIGENRVQELLEKYDLVDKRAVWHIIGHLQKNKVKYIADKVSMIHSVESFELAKEIDKQCKKFGRIMDILVEVNVSGEESKSGISPDEAIDFVREISVFENIRVKGLMTMAPLEASEEELHEIFSGLYNISVDISREKLDNVTMECLSMGMSNDYITAIEENSTIVRLGRCLFR